MLTFELVAGELMIEFFGRRIPMNQVKVFAVMFEVAADAILAIGIGHL